MANRLAAGIDTAVLKAVAALSPPGEGASSTPSMVKATCVEALDVPLETWTVNVSVTTWPPASAATNALALSRT